MGAGDHATSALVCGIWLHIDEMVILLVELVRIHELAITIITACVPATISV
jgi:hypothetical protein